MKYLSYVLCLCFLVMTQWLVGCGGSSSFPYGPSSSQNTNNQGAINNSNSTKGETSVPPVQSDLPKVNPWEDPVKDNLSTFAIDVDTASYSYSRRMIQGGALPPPMAVRVEEFVNYFDYKYEGPKAKDVPFKLHVDGAISPYNPENYILRVAMQGKRIDPSLRKPMHLTFLVDVSCSMTGADRISLVKKSLHILLGQLREGDSVAMGTYAGSIRKVLDPTDASQLSTIKAAIDTLTTGGGTSMADGMLMAYQMASKAFVKGHENRVIVLSDGDANIGKTSHTDMLKTIESYVKQGITMSTIGFGIGNYRDGRMEQLANKGNGNNYYIDSEKQAKRVFQQKFMGTIYTIAKDVKIQVEFDKEYIKQYRLIGYENRDIADKDFRNDKVDAGELGSGHSVTALYEVQLHKVKVIPLTESKSDIPLITVRLRFKSPDAGSDDKAAEIVTPVPGLLLHRPFLKTSWQLQWATAVMGFSEILRKSTYAQSWTLQQVQDVAKAAQQSNPDHTEFLDLVSKAKSMWK